MATPPGCQAARAAEDESEEVRIAAKRRWTRVRGMGRSFKGEGRLRF
jgi:hypothetical protein